MAVWRVPIEIEWTDPGNPGVNVFHIRSGGGPAPESEDVQGAVNAIHDYYEALAGGDGNFGPPFASGTVFRLGNIINVQTQETQSADWDPITIGAVGADTSPALQIVVSWKTSVAARRGTGRTFLGPLNAGVVNPDGGIVSAVRAYVLSHSQDLCDASSVDNGWGVGVYGLVAPLKQGPPSYVLRDFQSARVGTTFGVLRSRRD